MLLDSVAHFRPFQYCFRNQSSMCGLFCSICGGPFLTRCESSAQRSFEDVLVDFTDDDEYGDEILGLTLWDTSFNSQVLNHADVEVSSSTLRSG